MSTIKLIFISMILVSCWMKAGQGTTNFYQHFSRPSVHHYHPEQQMHNAPFPTLFKHMVRQGIGYGFLETAKLGTLELCMAAAQKVKGLFFKQSEQPDTQAKTSKRLETANELVQLQATLYAQQERILFCKKNAKTLDELARCAQLEAEHLAMTEGLSKLLLHHVSDQVTTTTEHKKAPPQGLLAR